jgi:predicted AlkP superfamily phosphohydrolase/phosphomutase
VKVGSVLSRAAVLASLVAAAVGVSAPPAAAYIGPGAGFALVSSFLVVFTTVIIAIAVLLIWPFRASWRYFRFYGKANPKIKRLIVLGLDGQEPKLTDRWMAEGKLPNFQRLAEQGCYHRLATTFPSISPVAWSSFSTGVSPAKHNIFDFLNRDLRTYLPDLSSTEIGDVKRVVKLGRWRIPLGKPDVRLLRKSKPFWSLLGDARIWSTVLRVPITFPPDRFKSGAELSAMAAPDLLGTQGTFQFFTTRSEDRKFKEGGIHLPLTRDTDGTYRGSLRGPENAFREGEPTMELPFSLQFDRTGGSAVLQIGKEKTELQVGKLSPWIKISFHAAPGINVRGLARVQLRESGEHVSLYVTPLSFDPEKPAMPISHPKYYATYLGKLIGPYNTLGLAEDTWALNEQVIDDATFLQQTWDIDQERRDMFFGAWDRLRKGCLVCVFDATDRIQHMFWRYLEDGHPAARGKENAPDRDAIEQLYRRNDELVGRAMARLKEGDVLMVISDHGFTSFRRGINLNKWLLANGYLHLKEGTDGSSEWLRDVDWSRTRVYAVGLTGMFLNLRGREAQGIVEPGEEAQRLKEEICERLHELRDPESGEIAINDVFDSAQLYQGPYLADGPDFVIGYNHGYRISWDCATGMVSGPFFEDNTKAWSGDHGVDPRIVPGVFFSNVPIHVDDPALIDIAPTALDLFGVEAPDYLEGKKLFISDPFAPTVEHEWERAEEPQQAGVTS